MICIIDTETYKKEGNKIVPVLDATGKYFVLGVIHKESGVSEVFYEPEKLWKRLIKLGKNASKHQKKLHVYGHNIRYDFNNIANLKDENIKWFSENPFIASYMQNTEKVFDKMKDLEKWQYYAKIEHIRYTIEKIDEKYKVKYKKEIIKFADSMSLYRMSLKAMGDIIDYPKTEIPLDIEGKYLSKNKLKEIEKYCINDCKVVLEGVKRIKKKLKEDGLGIRNLCTINQIAINYVMNELKKTKAEGLLIKKNDGENTKYMYKTKFPKEIHQAYRTGLTRVWNVGIFNNVCYTDKNSLYGYCLTNIDLPNLKTETKIEKPNKNIIKRIGISKVMLLNKDCDIGLIPVRLIEKTYVPTKGKYIIGIYTNMEIVEALKNGYKLLDIEWSIVYEKTENYLRDIFLELYKKRIEDDDKFNKFFYKNIQNCAIGKFGQRRVNQELCIDSIENIEQYIKVNGEILRGIDGTTNVLYRVQYENFTKPYYAPIIPCMVTAYARIYMYRYFKKIGKENMLYSDCDSLITRNDHRNILSIGNKLNQWKVEKDDKTGEELVKAKAIIWGSKSKSVGSNIGVAGAFKSDLTMEKFEKGIVQTKRQSGITNNQNVEVGRFITQERDLNEQKENFLETERLLEEEKIYIDKGTDDINYFLPKINEILEKYKKSDGITIKGQNS